MFVLLAMLALFAGCKGESSPTAPPTTPGPGVPPTSTGTPPVTGATVTLTVSNATPVVGSTAIISAAVTVNGQPAPNGTAVEFAVDNGSLCIAVSGCTETTPPTRSIVRTTTSGVATVVVTSSSAITTVVEAVVNNVSARTTVRFTAIPIDPQKPSTAPSITGVAPTLGRPAGGETITITGVNFRAPVRVLFDTGTGTIKEAQVISVTSTEIRVLSPGFDVGTGQQQKVSIIVINEAGSTNEVRVTAAAATFTYQSTVLTPHITTVSPAAGPINGGTRVTVFGDGFQAPLQVFFGSQEAQVISTTFNQVIVLSPAATTTSQNGSGVVTGPVDLRIVNINSATSVTAAQIFRYTPKMQITLAGPTEGPYTGGTDITIDGSGFDDPLSVVAAGVAAQVLRVSGTQILARTSGVVVTGCADVVGPIVVTNGENGDQATGPTFTYRVAKPVVVGVAAAGGGPIVPGSSVTVTVLNATSTFPQLTFGPIAVTPSGAVRNPNGTTTYTAVVPTTLTLGAGTCSAGGTTTQTTSFDIVFTAPETGCTATLRNGLTVLPPQTGSLFMTPNPLVLTGKAAVAPTVGPPPTPGSPAQNGSGSFTIVNNGAAPLTITSVVSNNATFTVTSDPSGTTIGPCDTALATVQYTAGAAGSSAATQIVVTATTGGNSITKNETVTGSTQ
jgi:hypothetical protein